MSDRKYSDVDSSDDNEEEKRLEENKRRSSIFQSRASQRHFDVDSQDESEAQEGNAQKEPDEFNLEEYVNSLKAEYEEWKKTLKERKHQRRLLAKQEEALKGGVELDFNVLTESDREFIQARPNYGAICEKINDVMPIAVKVAQGNIEINHLNDNLQQLLGEKIKESNIKIIKKYKQITNDIVDNC
ncbi:hypothetical protein KQX54_011442 [Cotesia glomerata]|uniref:Uncharacterized protein n=1 Tax=Cotesia glomerata TaxID=32391 RepID=A0AAV7J2C9_COTGL|nr:hypothetical protein KQX54_011442 [Cotesia glomerata]